MKTINFEDVAGKGANQIGFNQVRVETATEYAAEDADITLQLHHNCIRKSNAMKNLNYIYREIEMPVMQVLLTIERNGVLIDSELLAKQSHEIGKKLIELEKPSARTSRPAFNLNSPKQIQEILFDKLGLPVVKKTPSGTPSTDEDVLQELALDHPLPKVLLEYRGLAKLKSTYTDKLPRMVNASHRPRAHQLRPSRGGYRPLVQQRSQTAEYSRAQRRRPPHSRSVYRAARIEYCLCRLFTN